MAVAKGLKVVGYVDCPGGGQVVVRDGVAYVGHVCRRMARAVRRQRPGKPRKLAEIKVPAGTLSHKVRVDNGIMLVNREIHPIGRKIPISRWSRNLRHQPSRPLRVTSRAWPTRGMHRFTFDGRYVYGSPELEGYLGNVVSIIDFQKSDAPEEVGRWWMPGQWTAGGETPTWKGTDAPLPSSDARRQSPLCQLLARRVRHSRHRRHDQAEICFGPRLEPAVSVADPYGASGAVPAARPPRHAGRRRGRRPARRPDLACVSLAGRYHRRNAAGPVRELPGRGGGRNRRSATTPACISSAKTSAAPKFRSPGLRVA